jgi:zinc D-Ala-D-Ala carboxypeptidase
MMGGCLSFSSSSLSQLKVKQANFLYLPNKIKYMTKVNAFTAYWFSSWLFLLGACASGDSNMPVAERHASPQAVLVKTDTTHYLATTTPTALIPIDSSISTAYLMGQFDPERHPDFTAIAKEHASREGMYLRKDAYAKFVEMAAAAKKDGVHFTIKSATRNFDAQKTIWEGKWNGTRLLEGNENAHKAYPDPTKRALKILEYSSMPGTSRHHWGTDMDLNDFTNAYFEKGKGLKEYKWLVAHAGEYGFCQPYTAKGAERPDGYNEEKWHWSYLPISKNLSDQFKLRITNADITGFEGAAVAQDIKVVEKYVLGINKACL